MNTITTTTALSDMPPNTDKPLDEATVNRIFEDFESESPMRSLRGFWRWVVGILAVALSIYALYWTQINITTQIYRAAFLMITLTLSFLLYPFSKRQRAHIPIYDIALALLTIISLSYLLINYQEAIRRIITPNPLDVVMGVVLMVLVLEATRRAVGWILPCTALIFLLYGSFGSYIPGQFGHRGYDLDRIIGQNYLSLEGIFGVPLDVAATYIVLFAIYGAVLEYSRAGKFFLDWSFAALGHSQSGAGTGRTVTAAGFLLGTVSGSGVATTVTLGSVAWPLLRKAGYDRDTGGAILSAAGIGAILSPPTLGAAAFLIAEYLNISYLNVLLMATIPTVLYYLSCFLMIEADARRIHTQSVTVQTPPLGVLTLRYGYHFTSLLVVGVLMALGFTPFMAVFWSIMIAFALSFLRAETRLTSTWALLAAVLLAGGLTATGQRISEACFWGLMLSVTIATVLMLRREFFHRLGNNADARILQALEAGGRSVLSVAATTATAGVIVSIVTLTGLGLKIAGIIVSLAGGNLLLTVLYAAIAVWLLGLAVPVTASYIIAAVMVVPALTLLGVADAAAHMFIFYYAVLSEVSPPTALSPFAAAALTGGNPFRTMILTWKYCLPAFLTPFMFTLNAQGMGLLMIGDPVLIIWTFCTGCLAVAALAVTFGGWLLTSANMPERVFMGISGLALLYADPLSDMVGLILLVVTVLFHGLRARRKGAFSKSKVS